MTHRLSRLEQEGLIERIEDPQDKRSTLVGLTTQGQQRIEQALVVHTATQAAILATLSAAQREALETQLRALLLTFPGESVE
jgi:DNA-binding MarR family transcriptional regulator